MTDNAKNSPASNPAEVLHAYDLASFNGAGGTENSAYLVTRPFAVQPQIAVAPDASPILTGGEHFTITGQSDEQSYIGTAADAITGQAIGFIFEDSTTGQYFLFSKSAHIWDGTPVVLQVSTGAGMAMPPTGICAPARRFPIVSWPARR